MALRLAVIGYGYWGPNLVRNFFKLQGCQVVAVSDLRAERLDQVRRLYPSVEASGDSLALIRRPDVDAVAIVTPVATHYELAREALCAGKHVLVSKPMTQSYREASELVELACRRNLVLMVDHTFIYSGPVRVI